MILLIEHKTVIVTPPKTASDSLHRLFCSGPPWNGQELVGEHSAPGNIDKHYPRIPNEATRFTKLLTVRHPLDRLVALWFHRGRLQAYNGHGHCPFAEYVKQLADGRITGWLWKSTISQLVGDQQFDGFLRAERLAEDLQAAGLNVESVPRHNTSFRQPWNAYYDRDLLDLVLPWARPDLERFGYAWPPDLEEPCLL